MYQSEFDRFADEYRAQHAANIKASGEDPEYFARCKAEDARDFSISAPPQLPILDFGTGIGNSLPFLRAAFPNLDLVGIDVSQRSLEIAHARFPNLAELRLFDGARIPYDTGAFGMVFAACVFHHIDHGEHLEKLSEIYRVLAPGGWLILYEHNPWNPLTTHMVKNCPFDENARLISSRLMKGRVLQSGFTQVRLRYRVFFPAVLSFLRPLEPALCWLPMGAQYCLSCRK